MKDGCICPGRLNQRITVHALKTGLTPNAGGHVDETSDSNWRQVGREWAEIKTVGSREFFRGVEIAADITHQVTIRYGKNSATYTTGMKIKFDGRTFNIEGPPRNIDERNEWLVMACKEIK